MKNPYLACLAASLFSFYDLLQLSLFNVISLPLLNTFHFTTTDLGLLSSVFLWANALGLLGLGLVIDRCSVRKVALVFLALTSLASIGFAYSPWWGVDVVFRALQGLASAASLLIFVRMTTQWFKQNANFALSVGIALAVSGGVIGNLVFAWINQQLSWRLGLIIAGILGLFFWIALYYWLYDPRDNETLLYPRKFKSLLVSIKTALWQSQNLFAGLYLGLMSAPLFILGTLWGNYFLLKTYPITATQAALFSSLLFVGMIIGAPVWGRIADKIFKQTTLMYSACAVMLLLSLLLFLRSVSLLQLGLIFFSLGFFSSVQNLAYVIVNQTNSPEIISTATAITGIILNIVGALLQTLFGWLLTKISPNETGIILFLTAFAGCLILIFLLKARQLSLIKTIKVRVL